MACLWRGVETNHTKRKTHTQHKTYKQSTNFMRCALSLFPNAPIFILATFFSPDRDKPFAVSVLRFLWFAVGVVPILSPRAHSHILRGVSHFRTQHARPVFPLQIGVSVSLSLSRFLLSFISQSVQPFAVFLLSRCPCVFRNSLRPLFRFPVFLSGVPFGCWWFPFSVPVLRWFLAFGLACARRPFAACFSFCLRWCSLRCVSIVSHLRGWWSLRKPLQR